MSRPVSEQTGKFADVRPKLLRRLSGGWLAVSEDGASLRIGVEGGTYDEAEAAFYRERAAWTALWEADRA